MSEAALLNEVGSEASTVAGVASLIAAGTLRAP